MTQGERCCNCRRAHVWDVDGCLPFCFDCMTGQRGPIKDNSKLIGLDSKNAVTEQK